MKPLGVDQFPPAAGLLLASSRAPGAPGCGAPSVQRCGGPHCGTWGFGPGAKFFHSSLQPPKKIFSTANYKAFPTLSLNTGLDHCTLH